MSLQVTFRNMSHTPSVESMIGEKVAKLRTYYSRIDKCPIHVTVGIENKHPQKGNSYNIYNTRIELHAFDKELVSTKKSDKNVFASVSEAFEALSRQIAEHKRIREGRVKSHNHVLHGKVVRMVPDKGFGIIEDEAGSNYYFSVTNATHPQFSKLAIGDSVEYRPEPTQEGLQAQHVVRERRSMTG